LSIRVAGEAPGKKCDRSVYEACLLRFSPHHDTTMAALLAGVPSGWARPWIRACAGPLGISMIVWTYLQPGTSLYTTPVITSFFDNLSHRFSRKAAAQENGATGVRGPGMNISSPFIHRPVATTLIPLRWPSPASLHSGYCRILPSPGGFPHHFRRRKPSGRQRGGHGLLGGNPAGTAVWPDPGVTEMSSASSLGTHGHYHTVRPEPQH